MQRCLSYALWTITIKRTYIECWASVASPRVSIHWSRQSELSLGACKKTGSECRNPAFAQGWLREHPCSRTWREVGAHNLRSQRGLSSLSRCGEICKRKSCPNSHQNSALIFCFFFLPSFSWHVKLFSQRQNHELWQTTRLKACHWSKWSFAIFTPKALCGARLEQEGCREEESDARLRPLRSADAHRSPAGCCAQVARCPARI